MNAGCPVRGCIWFGTAGGEEEKEVEEEEEDFFFKSSKFCLFLQTLSPGSSPDGRVRSKDSGNIPFDARVESEASFNSKHGFPFL